MFFMYKISPSKKIDHPIYNSHKKRKISAYIPDKKCATPVRRGFKNYTEGHKKLNKWKEQPYS